MEDNTCCICGKEYDDAGHNPEPLVLEGRCCNACNVTVVIPARISLHFLGQRGRPNA